MSIRILLISFCISLLFSACRQYHTVAHDPLYKESSTQEIDFREEEPPLHYLHRIHAKQFREKDRYALLESESFSQYKKRLFRTLQVQEYENQQLKLLLEEKLHSLEVTKEELGIARAKYLQQLFYVASIHSSSGVSLEDQISMIRLFKKHPIEKGDTLQKISLKAYGVYSGWLMIYRFNLDRLSYGPNRIKIGEELFLPNISVERDLRLHEVRRKE